MYLAKIAEYEKAYKIEKKAFREEKDVLENERKLLSDEKEALSQKVQKLELANDDLEEQLQNNLLCLNS